MMAMVSDTDNTTIFPDTRDNSTIFPDTRGNSTIFPDTGGNSTVTLDDLNDAEVQLLIPTIVYLVVVSVVGMIGNSLVCNVYRTRYHLSNSQCFILCLGVMDLFSCTITIPLQVAIIFSQYNFKHTWLCKFIRFISSLGTVSASFLLLFIAIDRLRKVCHPFGWQFKANVTKFLCGLSLILGLVFSWPAVFIYGKQKFKIPKHGITGTKCSTDDSMLKSMFPLIHAAVFGCLFIVGTISVCIIYCLIRQEAKKHSKTMTKGSVNPKQALAQKTTFVMVLISVAFVASYVPCVLLMIVRQLRDGFEENLTDGERAVYKFFLYSFLLNCAINPVIYGFCDSRFRAACKETFSRWCAGESH